MNLETTRLGLPFFDDAVGGTYLGLPTLVKGRRGCGKAVLAAQFLDKVLRTGEKALVFCDGQPEAVLLDARSAGIDLEPAVRSGQLLLIPLHAAFAASRDGSFPFDEAVAELHAIASRSSVGFAVFNSVIPWLAVPPSAGSPHSSTCPLPVSYITRSGTGQKVISL